MLTPIIFRQLLRAIPGSGAGSAAVATWCVIVIVDYSRQCCFVLAVCLLLPILCADCAFAASGLSDISKLLRLLFPLFRLADSAYLSVSRIEEHFVVSKTTDIQELVVGCSGRMLTER